MHDIQLQVRAERDLALRADVSPERLKDRFALLKGINGSMPDLEKAVSSYALNDYYTKAYDLVLSEMILPSAWNFSSASSA